MNFKLMTFLKKSLFLFIFLLTPAFCFSQSLETASSFIHQPQELAIWLSQGFKYEGEMPDYWQTAQETLNLRKGDCEDFAILSQAVLARLGINSSILIIKFKDLKQSHAICVWKDEQSFYNIISNRKLMQTKARTIKAAVQEKYPDWQSIIFTNPKKQYIKVVRREKEKGAK